LLHQARSSVAAHREWPFHGRFAPTLSTVYQDFKEPPNLYSSIR
jgi:hypothetical protein